LAVLVNPSVAEAEKTVMEAFFKHRMLIVVGRCWVHYSGRASSKLELGERVLIIKEDGSLLVHRSVGYKPVNWQPPGCAFHARAGNGLLVIRAVRQTPAESVEVVFDEVQLVSAVNLVDSGEFSLYASEEDMHRAILVEPSLLEEGFKPISYEKMVEPGFLDVYGEDSSGKLVVVEVKRKAAGKQAVVQLARYVEAIRDKAGRQVRGILAAPDIGKGVHRLLDGFGLEFRRLDPKRCAETLQRSETRKLAEFLKETRADDSG
jgi:RecB family endonuclease NucS